MSPMISSMCTGYGYRMEPLVFTFTETLDHAQAMADGKPTPIVTVWHNGKRMGDPLNDNVPVGDGYRYHDVFHLGVYAKTGGRSPVMRLFLDQDPTQTPPAAWQLEREEILSIISFTDAQRLDFYQKRQPSSWALHTLDNLSDWSDVTTLRGTWRKTSKEIYTVFNQLLTHRGGDVLVDTHARTIAYQPAATPL